MVRARYSEVRAAEARRDAKRLRKAWDDCAAKAKALGDVQPCPSIWPTSLADVAPVGCQLLEGHVTQRGTRHRHRVLGSSVTVEWD